MVLAPEDNRLGQRPFTQEEAKGKVVVLLKGTWEPNQKGSFNVKCNNAAEGGAVGVIMINTTEGLFDIKPRMGIVAPTIPCVTISKTSGDELIEKFSLETLVLTKAFRGDHLIELLRGARNEDHTVGAPALALNKGKAYFEVAVESLENLKFHVGVAGLNFVVGGAQFVGDAHSIGLDGFGGKMGIMGTQKDLEQAWDDSCADGAFVVGVCVDFGFHSIFFTLNGEEVAEFPISANEFLYPAVTMNGKARLRFAEPWTFPPRSPVQPWAQHLNLRSVRTYERPPPVPAVKPNANANSNANANTNADVDTVEKIPPKVEVKRERRSPSERAARVERPRSRSRERSRDRSRERRRDRREDREERRKDDRDDRRKDDRDDRDDRRDDRKRDDRRERSRSRRRRR
eukprot:GEMP01017481.1.p1 GENE.GEMP01017481.1~~GEMP01017481.1.p1  ORF type:complete len:401 (+),score=88.77 GEMP01017481.1:941-2143(+)